MNHPKSTILNGLACLSVLTVSALSGAQVDPNEPASLAFAATPDKVSLFDGRSLGNWKKTDFFGQGEVSVENQTIVLGQGQDMTGITWAGPLLRMNYEIRLEAKRVAGNDFFCGLTVPVGDQYCSFICGGWGGGLVGISNVDWYDAANNQTSRHVDFNNGQWYTIHVRVTEKLLQAWIDGELMVDLDTEQHRFSVRMEVDKSRPLGVATWQTAAALRNISIRRCDSVDRYLETLAYTPNPLAGWTLQISETLEYEHPETLQEILKELEYPLERIRRVVPAGPLAKLQKVPIWLEHQDRDLTTTCYHISREWLRVRGYNPDKADGVEIAHAGRFLEESVGPSNLMLHPLARAYHDRVLGHDHPGIKKAYAAAQEKGRYEKVLHIGGSHRRHEALQDEQAYFAEGTEAFFGTNDYYPFVRAELKIHDPALYELLMEVWEVRAP
ncbi:MAG: DUF1080 domain-containing protein [Planctomycetes bacterium]|nr:DUF1080 domain-containing protein [Planctomycetota bacterium]